MWTASYKRLNIEFHKGVNLMKMHECDKCDQQFKRKENLNRHNETSHSENKKTYDCVHCDSTFNRQDSLKRHVKSKHLWNIVFHLYISCFIAPFINQNICVTYLYGFLYADTWRVIFYNYSINITFHKYQIQYFWKETLK